MANAVGAVGVFLKARDPQSPTAWYAAHLGIQSQDGGTLVFDGRSRPG
jgi:hypothetical protein